MSEPVATYRPAARVDGLIVTEAGADLVVFDEQTSHLHTLSVPGPPSGRPAMGRLTSRPSPSRPA